MLQILYICINLNIKKLAKKNAIMISHRIRTRKAKEFFTAELLNNFWQISRPQNAILMQYITNKFACTIIQNKTKGEILTAFTHFCIILTNFALAINKYLFFYLEMPKYT